MAMMPMRIDSTRPRAGEGRVGTVKVQPPAARRQAANKPIPSYATACKDGAAYSKACACIGVTAFTTEPLTPSITVTITATGLTQETSYETETNVITRTLTEETATTATETATTTLPPAEPPSVLSNGDFEKGQLADWRVLGNGEFEASVEAHPGAHGGNHVSYAYRGESLYEAEAYLLQRIHGLPESMYRLRYYWETNGFSSHCVTYAYFTGSTSDVVQPDSSMPPTMPAPTNQSPDDQWRASESSFVIGAGVSQGQVVAKFECSAQTYPEHVSIFVDDITLQRL